MPHPLRKNYQNYGYAPDYAYPLRKPQRKAPSPSYLPNAPYQKQNGAKIRYKKRVKKKVNPLSALVSLGFLGLCAYFVIPANLNNFFEPIFLNRFLNRNIKFDAVQYVEPTKNYLSNAQVMSSRVIVPVRRKNKEMLVLTPTSRMFELETQLKHLASSYPHLNPSIYVWDYTTSRSAEINPNQTFSSASIIKLPILIELFRKSESLKKAGLKPIDLHEELLFDEIHKASGSGTLQYEKTGVTYPVDYLAKIMIQASDNSATNMLLEKIGGMEGLNAAARKWGLESTQMTNWLPDLKGTNTISAEDMATLLYNIDNPKFLNEQSRFLIKECMSNVHNRTLLQAGIPKSAQILHKTGDIGTMLGDAGIIYAANGKKYIAVILVERPYNDYSARDFIKKASKIIYKSVAKGGH